jgi:hypothetical protein
VHRLFLEQGQDSGADVAAARARAAAAKGSMA